MLSGVDQVAHRGIFKAILRGDAPLAKMLLGHAWKDNPEKVRFNIAVWLCECVPFLYNSGAFHTFVDGGMSGAACWEFVCSLCAAPKNLDAKALAIQAELWKRSTLIKEELTLELEAFAEYLNANETVIDPVFSYILSFEVSSMQRLVVKAADFLYKTRPRQNVVILTDPLSIKARFETPWWLFDHRTDYGRLALDTVLEDTDNDLYRNEIIVAWGLVEGHRVRDLDSKCVLWQSAMQSMLPNGVDWWNEDIGPKIQSEIELLLGEVRCQKKETVQSVIEEEKPVVTSARTIQRQKRKRRKSGSKKSKS
jgi:hypothetical protein